MRKKTFAAAALLAAATLTLSACGSGDDGNSPVAVVSEDTATQAATVPVFLVGFISSEGLYFAQLCAAATIATLPVILAGWIAQRQLVRGLSFGAIK